MIHASKLVVTPPNLDDFDVIELENRIEAAYNAQHTPYVDSDYEVDAEFDFGTYFYRVWCNRTRLGCYYRLPNEDGKEWVAKAFYRNGNFIYEPAEGKRFTSHKQAERYIIRCWEGGKNV